jgi:hypothetical protein
MTNAIPNPARPYAEECPWPQQKPIFAMQASLAASMAGVLIFAGQYKACWTPLERSYFPAYVRTAHFVESRNPYICHPRNWQVLVILYAQQTAQEFMAKVGRSNEQRSSCRSESERQTHRLGFKVTP